MIDKNIIVIDEHGYPISIILCPKQYKAVLDLVK